MWNPENVAIGVYIARPELDSFRRGSFENMEQVDEGLSTMNGRSILLAAASISSQKRKAVV